MGKRITLYFQEKLENVTGRFDDPVRGDGSSRMPDYKQTISVPSPTVTTTTREILALIKQSPEEFASFGDIKVQDANGIIRLKTHLSEVPYLENCNYIIPHPDVVQISNIRYRLIRKPVPTGLKLNRYAISYWMVIE